MQILMGTYLQDFGMLYVNCISKSGIFYLSLFYFNHTARNVRIVQDEKLHKLIFQYEVSSYRALEGTSLKRI